MKLKFAKGVKLTAAQKAQLQGFEDKLDAVAAKQEALIKTADALDLKYGALLQKLGLVYSYKGAGKGLTLMREEDED